MLFGGLQKITLVDYPGKVAATVFAAGCNFRCPYCHNPELVLPELIKKQPKIKEKEILDFLTERKKLLEGICITGGEPTIQSDLIDFIKKVKDLGFLIKLDTNGSNPKALKELIKDNLLDFIAMDIKGSLDEYDKITNVKIDIKKIKESIKIIKDFKEYEFRMTVLPLFHSNKDFDKIGKILKGSKIFCIQQFRPKGCLDQNFEQEEQFSLKELEEFKKMLEKYIEKVKIRN